MPHTAIKHDENYYKSRKPKPDLGTVTNLKKFLWDPDRRAFLDRNAREWGNFGLFYLCFYGVLFTISYLQLWLTMKYVRSFDQPIIKFEKFSAENILDPIVNAMFRISSGDLQGPGIAMRPNIVSKDKMPLILLNETRRNGKPERYINEVTSFLQEYRQANRTSFEYNCTDRVLREDNVEKSCYFNVDSLGRCSQSPYGYTLPDAQPCVYIKFNQRLNWVPIFYGQASQLPESMPEWLKTHIRDSDRFHVWLSCEGQEPEDRDDVGEIEYLPGPGFPVQYFPYAGQPNYHAPVVALRFQNLTMNKTVTVACKTWARNIDNNGRYHLEFRILIANDTSPKLE